MIWNKWPETKPNKIGGEYVIWIKSSPASSVEDGTFVRAIWMGATGFYCAMLRDSLDDWTITHWGVVPVPEN